MFQLKFDIPKSKTSINLEDPILLIGSCFSTEIGSKLEANKFNVLRNPFGTIYNPHSIFKLLANNLNDDDIIESQGVYFHWDTHGAISSLSTEELKSQFSSKREHTQEFLKKAKWLIITLGTAIVYEHERIVANCHKVPSNKFSKRYLSQQEIIDSFEELKEYLNQLNAALNILFTVSPVRHIKDGLVENNRSKSILIDAVHTICEKHENVNYFPSYEIVIDELRDHRFYANDMVHPSKQAVDYVWDRFSDTFFNKSTDSFLKKWQTIRSAINHKPFQPSSKAHQKFLKNTLSKLGELNQKIDVSSEIDHIKSQIK